jgi:hypothetical protein
MRKENEIVVRSADLPKVDREFGITEQDRDLSEAKVLIEGKEAKRLKGDKDSVTVITPIDGEHPGPLQIVVTTNSNKPVGVLNYWWNGHQWEFQTPDTDHHRTDDGLSPVMNAIGDAAKIIVHAIEEWATSPAGGTATATAGGPATTPAEGTATMPAGGTDKKRTKETN